MLRYCPKRMKEKTKIFGQLTLIDIVLMFIGLIVAVIILAIGGFTEAFLIKLPFAIIVLIIAFFFNYPLTGEGSTRIRTHLKNFLKYAFRKKKYNSCCLSKDLGLEFNEKYVFHKGRGIYSVVLEIEPSLFILKNEEEQDDIINNLANAFLYPSKFTLIKTDMFMNVGTYYENNQEKINSLEPKINTDIAAFSEMKVLKEEEYYLKEYLTRQYTNPKYFIIVYDFKIENLESVVSDFMNQLKMAKFDSKIASDKVIKKLYKNYYDCIENEKGDLVTNDWYEKYNHVVAKVGKDEKGNEIFRKFKVFSIQNLPRRVRNGWLADLSNINGVKLSFKVGSPVQALKIKNVLSGSAVELRMQLSKPKKLYEQEEIEYQIDCINQLISDLNNGNIQVRNCYVNFLVPLEAEKEFLQQANLMQIGIDRLLFRQAEAYLNCDLFKFLNLKEMKGVSNEFTSDIIASAYPFIYPTFFDKKGQYIGDSMGLPVFFDPFYNLNGDSNYRVNANISITGTSGVGKSYLSKVILLNSATTVQKIRILDPENEYSILANNLFGKVINVAGGIETVNPLQIFTSINEDKNDEKNVVTLHKQFLEEFFKTAIKRLQDDDLLSSYLFKAVDVLYSRWNYYDGCELSSNPKDYPLIKDLYSLLEELYSNEIQKKNEYEAHYYKELLILLSSFIGEGNKAKLWNNYTTLSLDNKIIVFNFQSLLNSANKNISAAQMLLIMKFLNQEIAMNRNNNHLLNKEDKVMIMVDEAHNFISKDYPIALNFLYKMSKQIRKYFGSLIITTQQINDFLGGDENTAKLARGIIANCQYSFIFGNPNAVNEVKNLYGEIMNFTEEELKILRDNQQGTCLMQLSPMVRSILKVACIGDSSIYFNDSDIKEALIDSYNEISDIPFNETKEVIDNNENEEVKEKGNDIVFRNDEITITREDLEFLKSIKLNSN